MDEIKRLDILLNDLSYVARINPIAGIVSARTYIEGVMNILINLFI